MDKKTFNVIMAFEDGTFSSIENVKAKNKMDIFSKLFSDTMKDFNKVITITILEKKL